jgi:hypothetical protein
LVVIISLDSSEILEILDPSVLETGPSSFAKLGSVEYIVALHIGQKLDCLVCQTRTSSFSRKLNFPQFDRKPNACCAKSLATVFSFVEI